MDRLSEGRVRLRTGTVYSILDRLREAGLIEVEREEIVASRLRRYYRLTDAGAEFLGTEAQALRRRANAADSSLRQPPAQGRGPRGASPSALPGQFAHPVLFYRSEAEYLAGTVPFIEAGLDAGEAVSVAVPTTNLALIRDALGRRSDEVQLLDMAVVGRNPGRIIPAILLAFTRSHSERPVRVVEEPMWVGRTEAEYAACVQHEALINAALAGARATILCPYDAARLDPQVLSDATRTHPVIAGDGGYQPSDSYAPQDVVAAYNLPLAESELDGAAVLHVDVDNAAQAASFAAIQADRHGLASTRRRDVEFAVSELLSNSARHGGGRARLTIGVVDGYVVCQVQDGGTLTDPLAGRHPVLAGRNSGRGLLIVNRAADLVRTHAVSGRTTTRVYFELDPQ